MAKKIDDTAAMQLYEQNKTDKEIGEAFGVSGSAVFQWRRVRGLPSVNPPRKRASTTPPPPESVIETLEPVTETPVTVTKEVETVIHVATDLSGLMRTDTDRSPPERVNHPPHYNAGNVECIDAIEAATAGLEGIEAFCTASAIKYLWRWKRKGGTEDLRKAIWYIEKLIQRIAP